MLRVCFRQCTSPGAADFALHRSTSYAGGAARNCFLAHSCARRVQQVCVCVCVCVCECMCAVGVKMFLIQFLCIQLGEQEQPAGSAACRLKPFTPVTNSSQRTNSRCIRITSAASNTSWIQGGSRLKRQLQPRWHCYCRRLAGLLTS
jgi:hypothetical protein